MTLAANALFTHVAFSSSSLDWLMCLAFLALASGLLFEITRMLSTQRGAGLGAVSHWLGLVCVTLGFLVRLEILPIDTGEWDRDADIERDAGSEREKGRARYAHESGLLAVGLFFWLVYRPWKTYTRIRGYGDHAEHRAECAPR